MNNSEIINVFEYHKLISYKSLFKSFHNLFSKCIDYICIFAIGLVRISLAVQNAIDVFVFWKESSSNAVNPFCIGDGLTRDHNPFA